MIFKHMTLLMLVLLIVSVYSNTYNRKCQFCRENKRDEEVCGTDGKSYRSFCMLERKACLEGSDLQFLCDGQCPCDPIEVEIMDSHTVNKLKNLRTEYQLDEHIKRGEYENEGVVNDIYNNDGGNDNEKDFLVDFIRENENDLIPEVKNCSTIELEELPSRLIDWFHVLKTNDKEKISKAKGIKAPHALKYVNFIQAKLNSMYSQLACMPQDDVKVLKRICLLPVQWMFNHLDSDKSNTLSVEELKEIKKLENEHCIKPFLEGCDSDKDGMVSLVEFCKCLCYTPPCARALQSVPTILLNGEPRPLQGFFTPQCDEDGFFIPEQCNEHRQECWCANRNGDEFVGTRRSKNDSLKCSDNTHEELDKGLIPFSFEKQSSD